MPLEYAGASQIRRCLSDTQMPLSNADASQIRRCLSDTQMPLRYADALSVFFLVEEMTNLNLPNSQILDERGNGDQPTAAES
jgi:hypothetical protein